MAWAPCGPSSVQPGRRLAFELEFVAKARPLMDFYPPLPEANPLPLPDIGKLACAVATVCRGLLAPSPIPSAHHCGAIYLPTPAAAAGRASPGSPWQQRLVLLIDGTRDAVAGPGPRSKVYQAASTASRRS